MVLRPLIHVFMRGKRVIGFWDCQGLPLKTKPFVYCELCIVYCVLCNVYCLLYICVLFILHSVDILCSVLCILFTESLKTIEVYVYIGRGICHAALD